jgi:hypothetical protein
VLVTDDDVLEEEFGVMAAAYVQRGIQRIDTAGLVAQGGQGRSIVRCRRHDIDEEPA